jgi:NADH-quinone oxidoreductase subunit A
MFDKEYIPLGIFFIICLLLAVILTVVAYLVAPYEDNAEKSSSYECGFEPFENARIKFDIHFYLVAILFIIFDLEIIFLFPWCNNNVTGSEMSFYSVIAFITILTVGFIYEWKKEALTWK